MSDPVDTPTIAALICTPGDGRFAPGSRLPTTDGEAHTYALVPLVECDTCHGLGAVYADCCFQGPPCGHNEPCPAGCWGGWVPTDEARKMFSDYSFKRAIRKIKAGEA